MTSKRPVSRLAVTLMVLSVVAGTVGGVMIGREFLSTVGRPSFAVPGTTTVDIDGGGTWAVFERTGRHSQAGPVSITNNLGARHGLDAITVTAPGGETLAVDPVFGSETITRDDGEIFTAVAEFRAPSAGTYQVTIEGDPEGDAIVARELGGQFLGVLPWFLAIVASGLVFFGAGVGLIVSLVRRSRVSG
jgi:hypothetical protein